MIDYKEFTRNLGNSVRLWHVTKKQSWKALVETGFDGEFMAENSAIYGRGAYTTFDLKSSINNSRYQSGIYGNVIIECALIDGFKDFLFFDEAMNQKYNRGKPMEEQLRQLLPKEMFERVMNSREIGDILHVPHHTSYGNNNHGAGVRTAPRLTALLDVIAPWSRNYRSNGSSYRIDDFLVKTKIRGYIFRGNNDGNVAVVRDMKSLIPVRVSFDHGNTWKDIHSEENFNKITRSGDAVFKYQGKYPQTPMNEKAVCGYIRVKKDGKYNYVNVEDDSEILPVWADKALPFDPISKTGTFTINGEEFKTNGTNFFTKYGQRLNSNELENYFNKPDEKEDSLDFGSLFESICEDVMGENLETEVIKTPFDDFNKQLRSDSNSMVHLFHCTSASGLKGILNGGADAEYRGGEAVGRGVYCSYDLSSALSNRRSYGGNIVDYVLNDGLKDFLFYTDGMNRKYNGGKSLYDQYKELLPREMFEKMKDMDTFRTACQIGYGTSAVDAFLYRILPYFSQNKDKIGRYSRNASSDIAEDALRLTKVRGWVVDYGCGRSVIVRNYKDLIPVRCSKDGYVWKDCLTRENYELIANSEDASVRWRGKYPETLENERAVAGFLRVKKDGKYNYVNIKTESEVIPGWADNALPFDPVSKTGAFEINGEKYKTNGKTFTDKIGNTMDYQAFKNHLSGKDNDSDTGELDFGSLFESTYRKLENIRIENARHYGEKII